MENKYCPICLKEYETFPSKCTCGYDAFDKKDLLEDAQLFKIFKFAKQVYLGLISYDKSELRINESDDYLYIEDTLTDNEIISKLNDKLYEFLKEEK